MRSSSAWSYRLCKGFWGGLDLIFPPACASCGRAAYRVCPDCLSKIRPLAEPLCDRCGLPQTTNGLCIQCQDRPPSFDVLRSWSAFDGPLRKIVHRLKYRRDISLGGTLAAPLASFVSGLNWTVDMLIPVPLSRRRLAERGYNQVGMVGRPLSLALELAYVPRGLIRSRETRTQVGLSSAERRVNVKDAFTASPAYVHGKSVLLLDDVATTCSTLSSAAEALLHAGAEHILAVTLARALPHQGLYAA